MSDRLQPIIRSNLPASEQSTYDDFAKHVSGMFGSPDTSPFIFSRPSDGALVGPFPFLFMAPEAGLNYMNSVGQLSKIPGLPLDAREVAILTVGARYKAAYELYAHVNVAEKKVGMSKDVIEKIAKGEKPDGLNEACSIAFDVTTYLARTPGPLSKDLWRRSMDVLGKEGTCALVHYVGAYAYTCIMLNAMDADIPKEGD